GLNQSRMKCGLGAQTPHFRFSIFDFRFWTLDSNRPTVDFGLWTLDFNRWMLDVGCWMLVLFLSLIALPLRAQNSTAAFESANKLYYENKFPEAAAAYEKLLRPGTASAALYFNLGNAWFKAGQIGRALAAYRQAEQLSPRDPD